MTANALQRKITRRASSWFSLPTRYAGGLDKANSLEMGLSKMPTMRIGKPRMKLNMPITHSS